VVKRLAQRHLTGASLAERRARRAQLAKRSSSPTAKPKEGEPLKRVGDRIDIQATLRSRAKLMRASELASKLHTVQVLNTATVKDLIRDAVNEAVAFMDSTLGEKERKRILEEAEQGFKERMRIAEAERAGLEAKTQLLQEELKKTRTVLDEERSRVVSEYQFTVSDAGMVELEQRLGRILDKALRKGKAGSELEEELREIVSRLLDAERERIRDQAEQAQSDRIALLEKKVQRLATSLSSAEKERDKAQKRAQILEKSGVGPLRNVMDAGLDDEDPDRERKLELLREIFEFNKQVRSELVKEGRLSDAPAPRAQRTEDRSAPELSAKEESTLAESLGIKVRRPAEEVRAQRESVSEVASSSDMDTIQEPAVAAEGSAGEIDPDDLPWEAPEDLDDTVDRWKTVRNLGD
jgi:hypothetical protein